MGEHRRAVVVTGASSGIGRAAVEALIARGLRVFGSVRKTADGERLRDELGEHVTPVHLDVTQAETITSAAHTVQEAIGDDTLAGLVNNAGIAVPGPLLHLPLDELRHQFEVNLFGQVAMIQAFAPLLGARREPPGPPGRIVNISSVSGRLTSPFLGAYSASKHALEAVSDALRRELMLYGIDVIVVQPGAIKTPIWDKAEAEDVRRYGHTDYTELLESFQGFMIRKGRRGLEPARVGETVADAVTVERPRARYALPDEPWMGWRLPRMLPDRWVDRAIAKRMGLQRLDHRLPDAEES